MEKTFFVTTPIYYINDEPHIGHAYTTIIADVLARYHRSKGKKVLFLTGTDENSSKTIEGAIKLLNKIDIDREAIIEYTNSMASKWHQTWKRLNISLDDFIRTTETRHIETVNQFFKKVYDKGDIYKGIYKGLYCTGHEAFMTEADLIDGLCSDHKTRPEVVEEENYFFRLSKYEEPLRQHLHDHPDWIEPEPRRHEIREFIDQGLTDISISRPNQGWGIPLPIDKSQVIWVWFDALVNYLTAAEKFWPADVHIVGKDIMRFHTVTWGAMLMSAGYDLPRTVFGHGFFTIDGEKISKSLGNAIDPVEIVGQLGADALRYFLLREIPTGQDGDFSFKRLVGRYNADLANNLGNLIQRTIVMAKKYGIRTKIPNSKIQNPNKVPKPNDLNTKIDYAVVEKHIEGFQFDQALGYLWTILDQLNQYIDRQKPWDLAKRGDKKTLERVITTLVAHLWSISDRLKWFLPETATRIQKQLNIQHPSVLFPKKDR